MNLTNASATINLDSYERNGEWDIESTAVNTIWYVCLCTWSNLIGQLTIVDKVLYHQVLNLRIIIQFFTIISPSFTFYRDWKTRITYWWTWPISYLGPVDKKRQRLPQCQLFWSSDCNISYHILRQKVDADAGIAAPCELAFTTVN